MHMADALLSPAVGVTMWAGSMAAIGYSSRKLKENLEHKTLPLMGVLGAFIFAAQIINFTIPGTGSSGHLGGGMILAALLGPYAACLAIASVLSVQALFFADGGLLALGCNIWNLGVYPCFVAYPLIFKPLAGDGTNARRIAAASIVSAVIALQLGALSVVLETLLSGKSELHFGTFVLLMQPIHLAIGLVEGIVTAGLIGYVRNTRPEILQNDSSVRPLGAGLPVNRFLIVFVILTVAAGGVLSWFASTHPDGLEWSIERSVGKTQPAEKKQGLAAALGGIQEKTSFLPDYTFKPEVPETPAGQKAPVWPEMDAGRSIAGITGSGIVLGLILLIGFAIRHYRKKMR
ncbi:MAG: cobalamin biosynthesis protein CbiM [Deltaproteobacteria bacterium]|nr:cobalamin biosynthesis protein CbiM [Deltaproteobacteria bacterium]